DKVQFHLNVADVRQHAHHDRIGRRSTANLRRQAMRRDTLLISSTLLVGSLIGAGVVLIAQTGATPGHDRVPPFREPSPYMNQADIQSALNRLDPKLIASRTGGAIDFAKGKAVGVVRRRMRGPQYAIT